MVLQRGEPRTPWLAQVAGLLVTTTLSGAARMIPMPRLAATLPPRCLATCLARHVLTVEVQGEPKSFVDPDGLQLHAEESEMS